MRLHVSPSLCLSLIRLPEFNYQSLLKDFQHRCNFMQVLPGVMKPDVSIGIGLPHLKCVCCNSLICISISSSWKKKWNKKVVEDVRQAQALSAEWIVPPVVSTFPTVHNFTLKCLPLLFQLWLFRQAGRFCKAFRSITHSGTDLHVEKERLFFTGHKLCIDILSSRTSHKPWNFLISLYNGVESSWPIMEWNKTHLLRYSSSN